MLPEPSDLFSADRIIVLVPEEAGAVFGGNEGGSLGRMRGV